VAAGAVIGWKNLHYAWVGNDAGPFWHALMTAAGQLAAGAAMIALVATSARRARLDRSPTFHWADPAEISDLTRESGESGPPAGVRRHRGHWSREGKPRYRGSAWLAATYPARGLRRNWHGPCRPRR
jgi:hypothetical protein